MQSFYRCPVCAQPLSRFENTYRCAAGHSFDLSRRGYVNLLLGTVPQKSGDNKQMIQARHSFLVSGPYEPLAMKICSLFAANLDLTDPLLDAGCGTGYYTSFLCRSGFQTVYGCDISRPAVSLCTSGQTNASFCVSSCFQLPFIDGVFGGVLSVFAPNDPKELARVLRRDGLFLSVGPGAEHLWQLKKILYDHPQPNPVLNDKLEGFTMLAQETLHYQFALNRSDLIKALLEMTPYAYRTSETGKARLSALSRLDCNADFVLRFYQKNN